MFTNWLSHSYQVLNLTHGCQLARVLAWQFYFNYYTTLGPQHFMTRALLEYDNLVRTSPTRYLGGEFIGFGLECDLNSEVLNSIQNYRFSK